MHQTDFVAEALLEIGVALLGGGNVQHLGFGHERADPIDLRAFGDGAVDAADHLLLAFARHDAGGDRLPPRRLLVEARHVHVAVAGEQQRARDRRRRHHQKLGAAPGSFRLQREPLMHAEPMLLVDHHKSEVAERDGLLEQRVRADENVDATFCERGKDLFPLSAFLAAAEERDLQSCRRSEAANRLEVLACQQLGRRHERGLRAGLHRGRHGEQGNDGLAAADIALQEPQHAVGIGEIGVDFRQAPCLARR